jgi:hypothetical protein
VQGWQAMRGILLAAIPNKNGAREKPGLYITSNCVHWVETVSVLPRDLDGNPEDIPDRVEGHLADATRHPWRDLPQMKVKPRKLKLSGLPSPR